MSDDSTTPNTPTNVFQFPRLGFTLPPADPNPSTPATPGPAGTGATRPDWAAVTVTDGGRRSPLDLINTLPDPAILTPTHTPAAPQPGQVPATFHNQTSSPDMVGPRIGALSLAAILAVAVAALNGTHTALTNWWENRQTRHAETAPLREARLKHQTAMQAIADKAAQQQAKTRIPSSHEFGRKTLGSRTNSASGGGGGKPGGGSKGSPGSPGGRGSGFRTSGPASGGGGGGGGKKNTPKNHAPGTHHGSLLNGRGGNGGRGNKQPNSGSENSKHRGPRSPHHGKGTGHRGNHGAGHTLKKHHKNQPGHHPSPDRTGLGQALKDSTHKKAERRLERRRKHGLDKPALWGAGDTTSPKKDSKHTSKDTNPGQKTAKTDSAKQTSPKKPSRRRLDQAAWHDAKKAAARRWKKRRKHNADRPFLWAAGPKNTKSSADNPKPNPGNKPGPGAGNARRQGPKKTTGRQQPKQTRTDAGQKKSWRQKARDYARTHGRKSDCFTGDHPGPGEPPPDGWASWDDYNEFLRANLRDRMRNTHDNPRRNPFENASRAAQEPASYTVVSEHVPGSRAKRWEPAAIGRGTPALPATGPAALDAAPTSHTARPGTNRPKEPIAMPPTPARRTDPRIVKARNQAARTGQQVIAQARHMDARHETEITLDDALDQYEAFVSDAFKTSDQTTKLAARATKLRDTLAVFAEQLAVENNLIGVLFTGAMASLSESMDLVARMADEMSVSSLYAAEESESVANDLDDAYRPYTQEAIDRNLPAPSAPAHNEA